MSKVQELSGLLHAIRFQHVDEVLNGFAPSSEVSDHEKELHSLAATFTEKLNEIEWDIIKTDRLSEISSLSSLCIEVLLDCGTDGWCWLEDANERGEYDHDRWFKEHQAFEEAMHQGHSDFCYIISEIESDPEVRQLVLDSYGEVYQFARALMAGVMPLPTANDLSAILKPCAQ